MIAQANGESIRLHWEAPLYQGTQIVGGDGRTYLLPQVPGWSLTSEPGTPQLPYMTALIALPPEGTPRLQVSVGKSDAYALPYPLYPAPSVPQQSISNLQVPAESDTWAYDAEAYAADVWTPAESVTFQEIGRMRGVRLARVTFYPWRYRCEEGRFWVEITSEVEISIELPEVGGMATAQGGEDALVRALRSLVMNPDDVISVPSADGTGLQSESLPLSTAASSGRFHLTETGLYALPLSLLQSKGVFPAGGDPGRIQVSHGSQQVALYWDAAGQRFLFYAEPHPTRWADYEFYQVTYGTVAGVRMGTRSGSPSGLSVGTAWHLTTAEENHYYDSLYASPWNEDRWYWGCLAAPSSWQCPQSATYQRTLHTPATGGPAATLRVWLYGYTNIHSGHHVTATVNGTTVGTAIWQGIRPYTMTFSVPASLLHAGSNTLGLSLPLSPTEGVWLDAWTVQYSVASMVGSSLRFTGEATRRAYTIGGMTAIPQVYDVTDPNAPLVVAGTTIAGGSLTLGDDRSGPRTYFAALPSAIQTLTTLEAVPTFSEPGGADYLVVAPKAWISYLAPLVTLRTAEGHSPFVASAEAIYAAYGDGRMDPEAIRTFVAHAYATWSPRPAYLLLVGDGTWDPLNYLGYATPTLLPPYLADADPWLGEIPADNRYGAVDGTDTLPDLSVGRLPVSTTAELQTVVQKIVSYEQEMPEGGWNTRHLFVVDDPESSYNFPAEAAKVTPWVPVTHTVTSLLCADNSTPGSSLCGNVDQVHTRLLSEWNGGALIVNWVGHSSFQQWEHNRLFHTDDLPLLTNAQRLPVVIEMTCFTGNYTHPDPLQTGMDEAVMRLSGGGAVASWGSSGEGLGIDNTMLHRAFYQAAFGSAPSLGEATTAAKAAIAGTSGYYMVDSYHLFGDPALVFHLQVVPWTAQIYLPVVFRGK